MYKKFSKGHRLMAKPMYDKFYKKLKQMDDSTQAKWKVVKHKKLTSDKEFWSFVEYVMNQPLKCSAIGAMQLERAIRAMQWFKREYFLFCCRLNQMGAEKSQGGKTSESNIRHPRRSSGPAWSTC